MRQDQANSIAGQDSRKARLLRFLLWAFSRFGVNYLLRKLLWRNRIAILMYHDPKPEVMDRHLAYLRGVSTIVPFDELWRPRSKGPRAIVTIDDGMATNAELESVFRKHGVRPTLFLCTGIIRAAAGYWWVGRERGLVERLKTVTNGQRKAVLSACGFDETQSVTPRQALTPDELVSIGKWADFGAHTRYHPILTRCDDDEARREIAGSRSELTSTIGHDLDDFCYPNGDYAEREIAYVKEAGFRSARTCDPGWNSEQTDPFRLKSFYIDDAASVDKFAFQLTGAPAFLAYYLKRMRTLPDSARGRGAPPGHIDDFLEKRPSANSPSA